MADILGYSAMVTAAFQEGTEEAFLTRLYSALKEIRCFTRKHGGQWAEKVYSDNVIIGFPLAENYDEATDCEFQKAYGYAALYQLELCNRGFFIRGGISVGKIHIGDHLIFGDVLDELKSAEKEANDGPGPPRVVLMKSSVEHLERPAIRTNSVMLDDFVWKDEDGSSFVNYLHGLSTGPHERRLLKHKQLIEENLEKFGVGSPMEDERIWQKYQWLANYHNRFCRGVAKYNNEDFLVEL